MTGVDFARKMPLSGRPALLDGQTARESSRCHARGRICTTMNGKVEAPRIPCAELSPLESVTETV
jgi:hypothetical protein